MVTYNGADYMERCLGSLRAQTVPVRLVVVDNGSEDGTADTVERLWPEATILREQENHGFCKGNNLAAAQARTPFIMLLNQDTVLEPDCIEQLLATQAAHPEAGLIMAKVLLDHQPAGRRIINSIGNHANYLMFPSRVSGGLPDDDRKRPFEVQYVSGAAFLMRRDLYEELGGLDEALWMYQDDLDLSLRVRMLGHRPLCAPLAVVHHDYHGEHAPWKMHFLERNRLMLLRKFYRKRALWLMAPILVASEAGLLLVAARGGWLKEKLRAYKGFWKPDADSMADAERLREISGHSDAWLFTFLGPDLGVDAPTHTRLEGLGKWLFRAYYHLIRRFL